MRKHLQPSPSKIVLTAIIELKKGDGTSLSDIIKYAKSKYGIAEGALRARIASALKRGLEHNILVRENGLYRLNRGAACRKGGGGGGARRLAGRATRRAKTAAAAPRRKSAAAPTRRSSAPAKPSDAKKFFLCPECRELVVDEARDAGRSRYDLRSRAPDAGKSKSREPGSGDEDDNSRKLPWQHYLRMGISLRGRSLKDKK